MSLNLPGEWRLPDNLGKLPRAVTPRAHEPAESLLFRLALANGYPSIEALLLGTPNFPRELRIVRYSRDKYIALVARLAGVAEDLIDVTTPHRNSGGMTLYGNHFRKIRAVGKARICPVCLIEDTANFDTQESLRPFRRNWWEIQNVGACPFHAIPLIDCCPKCGKQLRLVDSPVSCACDRNADLRRIIAETVPDEDLLHDRWLLGRIGICGAEENGFLENLPIDVGSRLCMILGTLVEREFSFSGTRFAHPKYSAGTRAAGWRILRDWPSSFDDFLDRLVNANSTAKRLKGVRTARYGGLAALLKKEDSPELEVVFEAVRKHVHQHHLVSPTTRVFGQNLALGDKVALSVAAKAAGCGQIRFLKIAGSLGLSSSIEREVGTQTVPTDHIGTVKVFLDRSMETVEVCRLLGCGPKVVDKLIDAGVLRLKLSGNVSVTDLVERTDVENLMEAISVKVEEIHELKDEYFTVKQAHRFAFLGEAGILMALASGHLRAIGRLPSLTGFKSLVFDRVEFIDAILIVTGKTLSRRILDDKGWKSGTILYLKRMGYLNIDLRADYVDSAELNAFLTGHVAMAEMLDWEGTPSTWREIRKILRANGVSPVILSAPKVSAFWPRSRAQQALLSQSSSTADHKKLVQIIA